MGEEEYNFQPCTAVFMFSGLAACGFESPPHCGFYEWVFSLRFYASNSDGVEGSFYELSSHIFLPRGMLYSWSVFEDFPQSLNFAEFLRTLNMSIEACFRISYLLISYLEMLKTSVLGLGQDLGLLLVLGGAMTNSTYVSRCSFDLIPYRFKVRDKFSAYMTCLESSLWDGLVCLGRWEFDVISNELGGGLYRLDLREEYVFEKMLMRMTVAFFRPGFRLCDVWRERVS
ncbi:hypothetical protein F2Q68_00004857 [Brassica cretica]|nr:hypothetical protein F2Q68_00004857 [Brassica cretica]